MKLVQERCLPCIVNQTLKVANMVGLAEKDELLKKVFEYLSKVDYRASTTPELIGEIFAILKDETGNEDPYRETRMKYNTMFLERLPVFEQHIKESSNPFLTAVKYAIIGNIIDFNPIHNLGLSDVEAYFDRFIKDNLEIDDSSALQQEIRNARCILYLGDNCGEICLDRLLLKMMKEINPSCDVFFATRGYAVVNDSIKEDAYYVGIDEYAFIISNGDGSLGTILKRTTDEFRSIYERADIVIAKGQANYECLSEEDKNIFFLLVTKCDVIASCIGIEQMKMICMKHKRYMKG